MRKSYTVTQDADVMAPKWLSVRINYASVKYLYGFTDGHTVVKGVKISDQIAEIGDTVTFDGKRLSVERK